VTVTLATYRGRLLIRLNAGPPGLATVLKCMKLEWDRARAL